MMKFLRLLPFLVVVIFAGNCHVDGDDKSDDAIVANHTRINEPMAVQDSVIGLDNYRSLASIALELVVKKFSANGELFSRIHAVDPFSFNLFELDAIDLELNTSCELSGTADVIINGGGIDGNMNYQFQDCQSNAGSISGFLVRAVTGSGKPVGTYYVIADVRLQTIDTYGGVVTTRMKGLYNLFYHPEVGTRQNIIDSYVESGEQEQLLVSGYGSTKYLNWGFPQKSREIDYNLTVSGTGVFPNEPNSTLKVNTSHQPLRLDQYGGMLRGAVVLTASDGSRAELWSTRNPENSQVILFDGSGTEILRDIVQWSEFFELH